MTTDGPETLLEAVADSMWDEDGEGLVLLHQILTTIGDRVLVDFDADPEGLLLPYPLPKEDE